MLLATLGTIVFTVYLYIIVPKGFFPQEDTGRLTGMIQGDQNTSFQAMSRHLIELVNTVGKDPAVANVVAFTGGGGTDNTGRMTARLLAVVLVGATVFSEGVLAQTRSSADSTRASKPYKVQRTPDGQPDFQGYWSNTTYTPLQRPNNVTKPFFTKEEAEEAIKRAATEEAEQTVPGTIADVHYDFTQFGLDRSQSALALNLRSSLIVDPPDGKLPPLSAAGQRRAAERAEARKKMGGPFDAAQNQSLSVRCINMIGLNSKSLPVLSGCHNWG